MCAATHVLEGGLEDIRRPICSHTRGVRPDLRVLWERPLLGAALIAVLQDGLLHLFQRLVLDRDYGWFGLIVSGVGFYILNVVALTRERRRRRRSGASQQSP
jgi:hypothetical protein